MSPEQPGNREQGGATPSTGAIDLGVLEAESIVCGAWEQLLLKRRDHMESALEAAFVRCGTTYQYLAAAQRAGNPRTISSAHAALEKALELAHRRSIACNQARQASRREPSFPARDIDEYAVTASAAQPAPASPVQDALGPGTTKQEHHAGQAPGVSAAERLRTTATQRPGPGSPRVRGRIVVGVDPSENAGRAVDWAAREAADRGLALHLVHALDLPGAVGAAGERPGYFAARCAAGEALLAKAAGAVREQDPRLTVSSEIAVLGAAETLVDLSQDAALVVTGTRGHGGFAGLLLGSVSLKLATHAHCPSVVVRGLQTDEPLNEIVLGLEPGQSQAPVHFAFATAAVLGATVRAVRAWSPLPDYSDYSINEDLEERARTENFDAGALLKAAREDYPDVTVTTDAIHGNPVPTLIGAARATRLLIVGAHHHHGPLAIGSGPVVRGLLAHCPTPVAVVPIT